MSDSLLIVFVKNPEPGFVKKRLAASIGEREAASVYRRVAQNVIVAVDPCLHADADWDMAIAYWPQVAADSIRRWLGSSLKLVPQRGSDLGERMENAFKDGFSDGYSKICIIGSDCPSVTAEHIAGAFNELGCSDAIFGPAADGGYYLIGLSRDCPLLFAGISWSTDRVLSQSIEICRTSAMSCQLLPQLRDIDTADDLAFYSSQGSMP